jgi:hypothetical protein
MTLVEKLDSARLLSFGNPVNYGGVFYPNVIHAVLQSDWNTLAPYIKAAAKSHKKKHAELVAEIQSLDWNHSNKLYLFDCFNTIIPDEVFVDHVLLDKWFRGNHKLIVGPLVGADHDPALRHDIFGNPVTEAEWRFFGDNHFYLEDTEYPMRSLTVLGAEDTDIPSNIEVYPKKMLGHLKAVFNDESNSYYHDVSRFFDSDEVTEITRENCIVFVKDMDDDDEIEDKVTEWFEEEHAEDTLGVDEDITLKISEAGRWERAVKNIDAIEFELFLQV